jgi:hypothetical protein
VTGPLSSAKFDVSLRRSSMLHGPPRHEGEPPCPGLRRAAIDVVAMLRPQQDARAVREPRSASLRLLWRHPPSLEHCFGIFRVAAVPSCETSTWTETRRSRQRAAPADR